LDVFGLRFLQSSLDVFCTRQFTPDVTIMMQAFIATG